MPALYLAIKHSLKKQGKSEAEAKTIAAKTYNKRRAPGTPPVTRNYEKTARSYGKRRN